MFYSRVSKPTLNRSSETPTSWRTFFRQKDFDWFPAEQLRATIPNWHYRHISEDVLPALRSAGVTEDQIRQMTVENPRRIFERTGGY